MSEGLLKKKSKEKDNLDCRFFNKKVPAFVLRQAAWLDSAAHTARDCRRRSALRALPHARKGQVYVKKLLMVQVSVSSLLPK